MFYLLLNPLFENQKIEHTFEDFKTLTERKKSRFYRPYQDGKPWEYDENIIYEIKSDNRRFKHNRVNFKYNISNQLTEITTYQDEGKITEKCVYEYDGNKIKSFTKYVNQSNSVNPLTNKILISDNGTKIEEYINMPNKIDNKSVVDGNKLMTSVNTF